MKLFYYDTKPNFGDVLNEIIFNHFIPEILDENEEELLLGIGTVLGLLTLPKNVKKIIVFSSGLGYAKPPNLDSTYEIICVRGPLTAKALQIDSSYAITDGAILLKDIIKTPAPRKEFKWSYIPHWCSETFYEDWQSLIKNAKGNYISPMEDAYFIIDQIRKSEFVVTEAMHGAIVADVFRVPWIATKSYKHINTFKWTDWALSLNMKYNPVSFSPLYSKDRIISIINNKLPIFKNTLINKALSFFYHAYQKFVIKPIIHFKLKKLSLKRAMLSENEILEKKLTQLREKISTFKKSNS